MSNLEANKLETPSKEKLCIAEIKNGKVVFKQKPHSFEKHSETLQELVKFREMIQQLVSTVGTPITELEMEYRPLIVKLAYESDKTLPALARHINSQLLPSEDDDDDAVNAAAASQLLSTTVIEQTIQATMDRKNYGLESDLTNKLPTSVCVWRWEAKEPYKDCLPKNAQEKVASRLAERVKAKNELLSAFAKLSEQEQLAILHVKAGTKPSVKEFDKPSGSASSSVPASSIQSASGTADDTEKFKVPGSVESSSAKSKASRPKKPESIEKIAKAKKEKDAQKSLMANFFSKPKPKPSAASTVKPGQSSISATQKSEFEKTFKPFVRKKDAEVAPYNQFVSKNRIVSSGSKDDIIVLDSDDDAFTSGNMALLSREGRLQDALLALPKRPLYRPPASHTPSAKYKTHYSPAVRDLMSQLSEAEVTGDASLVRTITQKLADRDMVPAKVLIFTEDLRPGYFGTWTRSSRIVGSRSPFARDVIDIDYGYDSGEDWDEGESAGAGDDVVDDDEEDADSDGQDSDMDDWLVDDEDIEQGPPPDDPTFPNVPLMTKRKAEEDKKTSKKRKVVVPLVPFAKGPCWETSIGQCEDTIMHPYQIRFLNDASFSINPFTFVSTCQPERTQKPEPVFAVPALPNHRASDIENSQPQPPAVKKNPAPAPKTSFPDDHLPVLLDKVNTLQTNSLAVLVDTIYQELKVHKIKKNAIEAKVKEVGVKCREKKYWVVRDHAISNSNGENNASLAARS
ncbi:chromatin assembly factor subunit [Moniliophthora roreri]|nr:chromatin assembly factor subunit [Moniliophthora roreri]